MLWEQPVGQRSLSATLAALWGLGRHPRLPSVSWPLEQLWAARPGHTHSGMNNFAWHGLGRPKTGGRPGAMAEVCGRWAKRLEVVDSWFIVLWIPCGQVRLDGHLYPRAKMVQAYNIQPLWNKGANFTFSAISLWIDWSFRVHGGIFCYMVGKYWASGVSRRCSLLSIMKTGNT